MMQSATFALRAMVACALNALVAGAVFAGMPEDVASVLQPFVDKHELAGAVAEVATKDHVLDVETVGYADIAAGVPMKADTEFWIASQSKAMTAAALMMLVDAGKVNVDDPVENYLPEFKGQMMIAEQDGDHVLLKKPAHPITVKNVLTHTSGMCLNSPIECPKLDGLPLCEAVRSYALQPLQWEPDSKYSYSNAGINTAARIIEVVSGMPYEDFMQRRLFNPLGMRDTTFWPNDEQVGRMAKSYMPNTAYNGLEETQISDLTYPLSDRTRRFAMPAGGLFSTARDVTRFCQMILNDGEFDGHRYLSEAAVRQMTTRQTPAALGDSYGFGWSAGGDEFGHDGAMCTNMNVDTKRGLITIWMVQHTAFPGEGARCLSVFKESAEARFGNLP